jgi:hypothetical protein
MARTLEQIQASIIANIQSTPELVEANSTSTRAIWRLFSYVVSVAILILEQIIDVFKAENEITIASAIPNTAAWLTKSVFNFQYSATNPQIIQLNNLVPYYPVVDSSLRIITRCSVVTTISNKVTIKIAKSEPPVALSAAELSALQGYINTIGVAGVQYNCLSTAADRVYISGDIFYDGQYSSTIQGTVINAINTFLSSLPFNGQLKISDLELAIRNITGVNDLLIKDIKVRPYSTTFANGTYLIQNKTTISRLFPTISGYIVQEDTTGNTFADSLNFVSNV